MFFPLRRLVAPVLLGLLLALTAGSANAQITTAPVDTTVHATEDAHDAALPGEAAHGEEAHGEDAHGAEGHHEPTPPVFLVLPFVVLLLLIATGPLFFAHHWHHHYQKYAVGLGALVMLYYVVVYHTTSPLMHALLEYLSFIALLSSLFVASGGILIRTDFAGTPRANSLLLFVGAVIANVIGTTGASMLLIRPFMRLNQGRMQPYHIIFFIFIVSNVGGALTPIGDPPLFLGFLRGVPFFWTVEHLWYIWLPTVLILIGIFYVFDARNKLHSVREDAPPAMADLEATPSTGTPFDVPGKAKITLVGTHNFVWLAIIIGAVFIDPNIIPGVPNLYEMFHLPFGIREIIMFGVAFLAYRFANKEALKGNDFNFDPIKEVAWLFIGIFATMQPALKLIGVVAQQNADAIGVSTFYFGTGMLSGILDNAPTYVSFVSAAMGKFGLDVNVAQDVFYFASPEHADPQSWFYLQAISIAAVFFGALTYIGNGPNFMVKAIAESSGVKCPSFGGYITRYSLPILIPVYVLVWFIFFSGYVVVH